MKLAPHLVCLAALAIGCSSPGGGAEVTAPPTEEPAVEDAAPAYPPGPYGLKVGDTFPNLEFNGYKNAAGEWTKLAMIDYYDPDGSRGNYGIYFVASAEWCLPCREEADLLGTIFPTQYKDHGGVVIAALLQDVHHEPANQHTLDRWIPAHHISFDIVVDDQLTLVSPDQTGLPFGYVINPRDMKIFRITTGIRPAQTTIGPLNLLMRNNGGSPGN
jgi:hypothetical protein